jgi:hypothetical protein
VVIEHSLPDGEQLRRIATELTSEQPGGLPAGDGLDRVLDAAAGLTRYEAEGAFALSLTRHNALRPDAVPGIYQRVGSSGSKPGRKVSRDPSSN